MKKFLIAALVIGLVNFTPPPAASVEAAALNDADLNFCGYALFAKRKAILDAKRDNLKADQENLKSNQENLRKQLAKAWHDLGWQYYGMKAYGDALDAFKNALEIEPDNEVYQRDYDAALAKVNSGAEEKSPLEDSTPKFNGLG